MSASQKIFASCFAGWVFFGVAAKGACDPWAAALSVLFALTLSVAVLLHKSWASSSAGVRTDFLFPLGGLLAAGGLSFLRSVNPAESFFFGTVCFSALLGFWAALQVFSSDDVVEAFLRVVAPVFWLEALVIGYQAFFFDYGHVPPGTLVNASMLTAFLILWTPVLGERAYSFWRSSGCVPWYWGSSLLCALFCLAQARSVWGWLCLLACLPLLGGWRVLRGYAARQPAFFRGVVLGTFCAAAGIVAWKFMHTRNLNGYPRPAGESWWRLYWWLAGWRMFLDHPWTGVGPGNFSRAFLAYKVGSPQNTLFAHNLIVAISAETGLIGLAAFFAFTAAFWRTIRGVCGSRRPFLVGLAAFILYCMVGVGWESPVNLLVCGLFCAVLAAPVLGLLRRPRRWLQLALAAAAIAAVPYFLASFEADRLQVGAQQALSEGDAQAAGRGFWAAAQLDARNSEAWRGLARMRVLAGRSRRDLLWTEEAVYFRRMAVERDRLNGVLWGELADDLLAAGRRQEALDAYRRSRQLNGPVRPFLGQKTHSE
ncbi:MAG: O-antigen ligase family protein [Elusimicrobiota bacterium]|jgi:O-antigen ligase